MGVLPIKLMLKLENFIINTSCADLRPLLFTYYMGPNRANLCVKWRLWVILKWNELYSRNIWKMGHWMISAPPYTLLTCIRIAYFAKNFFSQSYIFNLAVYWNIISQNKTINKVKSRNLSQFNLTKQKPNPTFHI